MICSEKEEFLRELNNEEINVSKINIDLEKEEKSELPLLLEIGSKWNVWM